MHLPQCRLQMMFLEKHLQRTRPEAIHMVRKKGWREMDCPSSPSQRVIKITRLVEQPVFIGDFYVECAAPSQRTRDCTQSDIRIIKMFKNGRQDDDVKRTEREVTIFDRLLQDLGAGILRSISRKG